MYLYNNMDPQFFLEHPKIDKIMSAELESNDQIFDRIEKKREISEKLENDIEFKEQYMSALGKNDSELETSDYILSLIKETQESRNVPEQKKDENKCESTKTDDKYIIYIHNVESLTIVQK